MKKLMMFMTVFGVIFSVLSPSAVATSAGFSASASASTITVGSNVTVSVRVNSGSNLMDSAQATLNFDSSKLKYSSHSGGAFSPVRQNPGGSSFVFVGAIFGGSTSGSQLLFSVTFSSIDTGTASVSLSGVGAAYSGSALSISSSSGTSIAVQAPASSSPSSPPPPSSSPTSSPTQTPTSTSVPRTSTQPAGQNDADTEPPVIQGEPEFSVTKSTITAKVNSNEISSLVIIYSLKDKDDKKQIKSESPSNSHELVIGKETPLQAGQVYEISVQLTDVAGNVADQKIYSVKTEGVDYAIQIKDSSNQPLANYPVTLFSDPIESKTDDNGVVVFKDVTPGEHTVVIEIDGVIIRQPVVVGEDFALQQATIENIVVLELPFALSNTNQVQAGRSYSDILAALVAGILVALSIERMWRFGWHKKLHKKIKSIQTDKIT